MTKLNLYCSGGMALNVGAHFAKYTAKQSPGFAEISTYFIDTSKSNLGAGIPEENIYLVDGLDGSGKVRASNYTALAECSKEILHKFKPADVNVVLSSASGGTGSTISPILVSELLARGELVVVIMVGSTSSRIETENTLKTLKSYEMISHKRQLPVVAAYRENSSKTPRGMVDAEIQTLIVLLAALFSGENRELDMSDLRNFINFNKVTSYTPKLSMLDFFSEKIILEKGEALVTVATLVDDTTHSEVDIPTEYQATGYLPEVTKKGLTVGLPVHTCVIAGYFNGVVDRLESKLKVYDEARKVVVEKSIVNENHASTDDGLIL